MKRSSENTVGLRILELRRKHRMSQGKFAECIFSSPSAVGQWERGMRFPPCETIILICNTFNVSADWLLGIKWNGVGKGGAA